MKLRSPKEPIKMQLIVSINKKKSRMPVDFKKKNLTIKTQTTLKDDWKTIHNQTSEKMRSTRRPGRQK